jgi:hypothetical protein
MDNIRYQVLMKQAIGYANDFGIQVVGITNDGYLATTRPCVDYQLKAGKLLVIVDGNWDLRSKDGYVGWEQSKPTTIQYIVEANSELLPWTDNELHDIWKAGQRYWETSGATITFEELLQHMKAQKGVWKPAEIKIDK